MEGTNVMETINREINKVQITITSLISEKKEYELEVQKLKNELIMLQKKQNELITQNTQCQDKKIEETMKKKIEELTTENERMKKEFESIQNEKLTKNDEFEKRKPKTTPKISRQEQCLKGKKINELTQKERNEMNKCLEQGWNPSTQVSRHGGNIHDEDDDLFSNVSSDDSVDTLDYLTTIKEKNKEYYKLYE
jgi:hypothetical protein